MPVPSGTPQSWAQQAADNETRIIADDGSTPLRYRERKVDPKGETVREIIETRQGNVARLIERNGQPLTAQEDAAEIARLNDILANPDDFLKHHKHDASSRESTVDTVRLMPRAMLYTFAAGQPQLPQQASPQVVLDFQPNPDFHPPTLYADVLTGLKGRLWIDAKTHVVLRAEGRIIKPVSFGFGIFGKLYSGGTIVFEQTNPAAERWVYSHADTHLTVRAVVKVIIMNQEITGTDFRPLPHPVTFQEAVRLLLATPVATR